MCVVVCGGALTWFQIQKDKKLKEQTKKVETTGVAAIGGPWVLVNQHGQPVTDASYAGQFTLLYFGFTHCPDICPNELVKIGKIVDELNARSAARAQKDKSKALPLLTPVFISVDPARDSVGQLRYYSKDFHPSIQWLTGTTEQVAAVARAFRVYFSKANQHEDDEDDYLLDHSIVLYLMVPGSDGLPQNFAEFYTQRMLVGEVVDKIEAQMDKARAGAAAAK